MKMIRKAVSVKTKEDYQLLTNIVNRLMGFLLLDIKHLKFRKTCSQASKHSFKEIKSFKNIKSV
jgi:hypothetical protein